MAGFISNIVKGLVPNLSVASSIYSAKKPRTQGLLPPDSMNASFGQSTPQNTFQPQSQTKAPNLGASPVTMAKPTTGLVPPPTNNPFSTENYYKEHPSANPANNSPIDTNPYTSKPPTYPGLVGSLASTASQPSQGFLDAQKQYGEANRGLQQLKTDAATQSANIGRSRTNLAEAGGEEGILQGLVAGKSAALTGEMTAAQQAAAQATAQQQAQQQGLGAAAEFSAPQAANALGTFAPTTGQYNQYGGGQGGGAFQAGQVQGQLALGQQYAQTIEPAYRQAGTIKDSFQQFLAQNPGLNASTLNVGNIAQQWLAGKQLSDPNQQKLAQFLTEFTNTLAPIIGASGEVTNFKQGLVTSLINSSAKGESISQAVNSLYDIASRKVQDLLASGSGAPLGNTGSPQDPLGIR